MDEGLTDNKGVPKSLFHIALILTLQNTLTLDKPIWIQRALFGTLLQIGKVTNVYKPLVKYTGKN